MFLLRVGGKLQSKVKQTMIIAIGLLAASVILSLVGSVSSEELLRFSNEVQMSKGTKILKISQLINDTSFISLSCLNINLTLINLRSDREIWLDIYERESFKSLKIAPEERAVLSLKPPYNTYTFVLEGEKCPNFLVEADCLAITYPYRYLSVVSLIFFFTGTVLLINSLFRELPKSLREDGGEALSIKSSSKAATCL